MSLNSNRERFWWLTQLSNIPFIYRMFFMYKMQEGDNLLDHINKIKLLVDQLVCLKISMQIEDIIMTLFESLLT